MIKIKCTSIDIPLDYSSTIAYLIDHHVIVSLNHYVDILKMLWLIDKRLQKCWLKSRYNNHRLIRLIRLSRLSRYRFYRLIFKYEFFRVVVH